ncbi:MAG: cadherin-like domain-containing protein, partial [Phycisphaerales bacterium]|nr:cadherin-like domain-containing protein [Phycisphaerales bacterium]
VLGNEIGNSAPARVLIDLQPVNDAPVAGGQQVTLNEDGTAAIILSARDIDGDALTYRVTAPPLHGTLTGTPPRLTYRPEGNYFGPDRFGFAVDDGQVDSTVAAVDINVVAVNDPPVAVAQVFPIVSLAPGESNVVVISPNNSNAIVVLDASLSSDVENDVLQYFWYAQGEPLAAGVRVTNVFEVGDFKITLQVSEGMDVGADTIHVDVITSAEAAGALVLLLEDAAIERRSSRGLMATLKAAMAAFERGQFHTGANQLRALQNKLRAQIAPTDPFTADALINLAQEIIDAVDGF